MPSTDTFRTDRHTRIFFDAKYLILLYNRWLNLQSTNTVGEKHDRRARAGEGS